MSWIVKQDENESSKLLHKLILKNHQEFDILYNDYFANHLVHALCTLHCLGANNERMNQFYTTYSKKLNPLREPKFLVTDENWETFICNRSTYAELIVYFRNQLSVLGIQKSLDKFIPRLLPGFIGGLFHPMIQIGYGLEYNFPQVVAEGLAYACLRYNNVGEIIGKLPNCDGTGSSATALEIIRLFQEMKISAPNENRKMFPVQRLLDYEQIVVDLLSKWNFKDLTTRGIKEKLDEITLACILVFFGSYDQRTLDFNLAHSLTGLHAVRTMLPYLSLENQKKLLQVNFCGLIGNYWFQGSPKFDEKTILDYNSANSLNWESIIDKSINCDESHVMKVIRSLLVIRDNVEKDFISDELLLRSGQMIVNLIHCDKDWEFDGIGRK